MTPDECCGPLSVCRTPPAQLMVYLHILNAFPRLGRPPSISEIENDLLLPHETVLSSLDSLASRGALRFGPTAGMILDAYPYSAVPTRHRVHFEDGRHLHCMCAVDTFYVPFLTGRDLAIRSQCFRCRKDIEIVMGQRQITGAEPAHSVVWSSVAAYDCPKTNFFCCEDHLLEWRRTAPDEQGCVLTLAEALQRGKEAADRIMKLKDGLNDILWAEARELVCHCRQVSKATIVAAIARGASSAEDVAKETTACTGGWCESTNPKGRCCCVEIEALVKIYLEELGNRKMPRTGEIPNERERSDAHGSRAPR